jgi:hypothetical protein
MLFFQHHSYLREGGICKGFYQSLAYLYYRNAIPAFGYGCGIVGGLCVGSYSAHIPMGFGLLFCLFFVAGYRPKA